VAYHLTSIEYRKLITAISEQFNEEDLLRTVGLYDVPRNFSSTPLETLKYLIKIRMFSEFNMEPLVDLLRRINRCDLIEKVEAFQEQSAGIYVTLSLPPPPPLPPPRPPRPLSRPLSCPFSRPLSRPPIPERGKSLGEVYTKEKIASQGERQQLEQIHEIMSMRSMELESQITELRTILRDQTSLARHLSVTSPISRSKLRPVLSMPLLQHSGDRPIPKPRRATLDRGAAPHIAKCEY
jgi:hypothetical protein